MSAPVLSATAPSLRVRARADGALELAELPRVRLLVLSPHLDDAVLSCGDLLRGLAPRGARVVTVFTEQRGPHTASARAFARQCATGDLADLYARRRAEDAAVLDGLGVAWSHAGLHDALFRARPAGRARAALGRLLPEVLHAYPTYRWHVARGRVARHDGAAAAVVDLLAAAAQEHASGAGAGAGAGAAGPRAGRDPLLVAAPLGVGRHVDHVLVRDAAVRSGLPLVHYADVPYCLSEDPDPRFTAAHDLVPVAVPRTGAGKRPLVQGYATQVAPLFPGGVPELADQLLVPRAMLRAHP